MGFMFEAEWLALAADPPHIKDEEAPCFACGAIWVKAEDGTSTIQHTESCRYMLYTKS